MKIVHQTFLILVLSLFSALIPAQQSADSLDIWSLSLDEVLNLKVISAQKTERNLNRTPASVVVITAKEIQRYGCTDLKDVLNMVPGLYLWNGYHVRGRINIGIRGYTSSDNVIILVNGVNQVEGVYNEYLLTKVGVPVEAMVAAIFWQIRPDLPIPETTTRPEQARIICTARAKLSSNRKPRVCTASASIRMTRRAASSISLELSIIA